VRLSSPPLAPTRLYRDQQAMPVALGRPGLAAGSGPGGVTLDQGLLRKAKQAPPTPRGAQTTPRPSEVPRTPRPWTNCAEKPVRPKVVASTATVRRAERQIRALLCRRTLDVFPPGTRPVAACRLRGVEAAAPAEQARVPGPALLPAALGVAPAADGGGAGVRLP